MLNSPGFHQFAPDCNATSIVISACSEQAEMYYINHWIPRRPVPDAALPPASMQAGLRRNDNGARGQISVIPVCLLINLERDDKI